jgi:hypothetical protein
MKVGLLWWTAKKESAMTHWAKKESAMTHWAKKESAMTHWAKKECTSVYDGRKGSTAHNQEIKRLHSSVNILITNCVLCRCN